MVASSDCGIFNNTIRLFNTCITAVPITTPTILPSPPRRLHPPSTAAAIAYNSNEFPKLDGDIELNSIANNIPPNAARSAHKT